MSTLPRRRPRRGLAPLALLALATLAPFLAGCGGGGWYAPPAGTLEIRNDPYSFEGIDAVEISVPFGPVEHYDLYLAPGDRDFLDLLPDVYDVDVLWSDGFVDTFYGVQIDDGWTTTLTGSN